VDRFDSIATLICDSKTKVWSVQVGSELGKACTVFLEILQWGVQEVFLLVLQCKRDSGINNDKYKLGQGWVEFDGEGAGRRGWKD
jgi:hypothetical protein